jgi:hypothetical protein
MEIPEMPYGSGPNLEAVDLCAYEDDDGHRPFRMFIQNPEDCTVEFRGYLCLCGLFVDLKYNPDSYFRVGKCGVSPHFGCEVLLAQGIQAPYLLAPDYRDHVRPAESNYFFTRFGLETHAWHTEWEEFVNRPRAIKELEEYLGPLSAKTFP